MNCELCRANLDSYVDEGLSPEELGAVHEHLRTCQNCAADALARLQMKRETRAAAAKRFTPSPEFRIRIEQAMRPQRKPFWKIGTLPVWMHGVGVAALALLLIAVSVILSTRHAANDQAIAEFLDMHVATMASANPVDVVSTDRHTVKPWFQGKLPFAFNLPEVQDSPYKLLGGKVIFFDYSPGAQLLYELRKHQLSVFIVQEHAGWHPFDLASTTGSEKGFSVESWTGSGLRYVVISDTNRADVHGLGELLRTAAPQ
jgi:anti-sigma factor RsiW